MRRQVRRSGRVLAAGRQTIEIRLDPEGCGPCHLGRGCGAAFSFFTGWRRPIVRLPRTTAAPLSPGTRVAVSIPEALLERLGVIAYGAPLAGLFSGLIAATLWIGVLPGAGHSGFAPAAAGRSPAVMAAGDLWALGLIIAGLLLGLAAGRRLASRLLPAELALAISEISD